MAPRSEIWCNVTHISGCWRRCHLTSATVQAGAQGGRGGEVFSMRRAAGRPRFLFTRAGRSAGPRHRGRPSLRAAAPPQPAFSARRSSSSRGRRRSAKVGQLARPSCWRKLRGGGGGGHGRRRWSRWKEVGDSNSRVGYCKQGWGGGSPNLALIP